jgi:hypothetical protein
LIGDASKARSELGWSPSVTFRGLIEMMVDADLERLKAEGKGQQAEGKRPQAEDGARTR